MRSGWRRCRAKRCWPRATMASRRGRLSIGSMETTAAVRLPSLLAEFHRRFPGGAADAADRRRRRIWWPPCSTARWTAPSSPARSSMPNSRSTIAFREELVLRQRAALDKSRGVARGHAGIRPDRAGVPHRLHLPAAAGTGVFGIRLAVGRAVRTRHARRHDRLRRRRHGRHAVAARGGRSDNEHRQHPHAERGAVAGRDPLHPAPQRASIQRAAGLCLLPDKSGDVIAA